MKRCTVCGVEKPLSEFHRQYGGKRPDCKACRKIETRDRYAKNKDHIDEVNKRWGAKNKRKVRADSNAWKQKNREKNRKSNRESARRAYAKDPERIRATSKRYAGNNKEKVKARSSRYRKNNPDIIHRQGHVRRARKRNAPTDHWTRQQIIDRDIRDGVLICYLCKEPIDLKAPRRTGLEGWERGVQFDHKIPLSKDGTNMSENIAPVHGLCNQIKQAKIIQEMAGLPHVP